MTPLERQDPKVLNGSRRARIALGSGRKVQDVNSLVEKFSAAQKMMKQMRKGGAIPAGMKKGMGLPPGANFGVPSLPEISSAPRKKKSKSGNPAKRAAQERG